MRFVFDVNYSTGLTPEKILSGLPPTITWKPAAIEQASWPHIQIIAPDHVAAQQARKVLAWRAALNNLRFTQQPA